MKGQNWWSFLLQVIIIAFVVVVVYNVIKKYLLNKIKINKWIVLGLALLTLFIPVLLTLAGVNANGPIWQYITSAIFILFFMWFLDLMGVGADRVKNNVASKNTEFIKPKAKPNRVKNSDMEVITIKKGKKNKK